MAQKFFVTKLKADMNNDSVVNYLDLIEWIGWLAILPGRFVIQVVLSVKPGQLLLQFFDIKNPLFLEILISLAIWVYVILQALHLRERETQNLIAEKIQSAMHTLLTTTGLKKQAPSFREQIREAVKSTADTHKPQAPNSVTAENLARNGEFLAAAEMYELLSQPRRALELYSLLAPKNKEFYVKMAAIHFKLEEPQKALEACLASENLRAIVEATRKLQAWDTMAQFMSEHEVQKEDMALLNTAYWNHCLPQLQPTDKNIAWLGRCIDASNSFALLEQALAAFHKDTTFAPRLWQILSGEFASRFVNHLLNASGETKHPVGLFAKHALGLYNAQKYLLAAKLYEAENRFVVAGKCYAFAGFLNKARHLFEQGNDKELAAAVSAFIATLPPSLNPENTGDLPKEFDYQLRRVLSAIDPAMESLHAASPFAMPS
jgi:hypothetical protein